MEEETRHVTEVHTQTRDVPVGTEHPQKVYAKKKTIFRIYQVIWYVLGVIETLLVFRIVLKALGANPTSGFANLIYSLSNPLALPFRGIFPTPVVEGSVFEWSTLIAGIVYLVLAYGLVYLFQIVKPTTPLEVEQKVNQ
jgi:hypothetical protein